METHRDRLRREHEESVDDFYTEREEDRSTLKGFAVAFAIMLVFVYIVFKIMQWYVSTMPPLRLH